MEIAQHRPGTFCWLELGTTDQAGAKQFYTTLFGWSFIDVPMGPDSVYTILQVREKDVAALYQFDEAMRSQGVPPHWLNYVCAESADATVEKATAAGGLVVMPPFDVQDHGRMAVMTDPQGATFAVWEPRTHTGIQIINETNAAVWFELATSDPVAAAEFYGQVFGWRAKTDTSSDNPYTEFQPADPNEQRGIGGMLQIREEWGQVPPYWMVYFAVDDCVQKTEQAGSLGATILKAPASIPNVGTFSVLQDPQGAVFAIIDLSGMG